MPRFLVLALFGVSVLFLGCGGGGGSSSGNNPIVTSGQNVQPITVDAGPANNYVNGVFTRVAVCIPGSSNCQTISGVLVDTGSSGLRILSSALSLSLPQQTDSNSNPTAECNPFQGGYTWGPTKLADVRMAGEQANMVPIQVIGDPSFSAVPSSCTNTGLPTKDTVETLGANGILGVGPFRQDCGAACAESGPANPGLYYICPSSGCQPTAVSLSQQMQNPVWLFATDNNGVIIELPSVPSTGAASVNGSLIFGIGTQANNALGGATVFATDAQGNFTTIYQGQSYSSSFIDSGANAIFFLDSSITGVGVCNDNPSFYCPSSLQNLSATNQGTNGATGTVNFSVANADSLFANPSLFAFGNLAGPQPGSFAWGLTFFFGRNVFTAIEAQNTPAGPGPYFAY